MRSAMPRDPFPEPGTYRFRVAGVTWGVNPGKNDRESVKTRFTIADLDEQGAASHSLGDSLVMVNFYTKPGMAEFQSFVVAAAGFESDEEFIAATDDDGTFVDALIAGSGALDGRLVDVIVTKGLPAKDGNVYPRYQWAVVAEEEQDQTKNVAAQKAASPN